MAHIRPAPMLHLHGEADDLAPVGGNARARAHAYVATVEFLRAALGR